MKRKIKNENEEMKIKKVSVIIPITREKLAQKTIKSVRAQNYSDLEIIKVKAKSLNPAQASNKSAGKVRGKVLHISIIIATISFINTVI